MHNQATLVGIVNVKRLIFEELSRVLHVVVHVLDASVNLTTSLLDGFAHFCRDRSSQSLFILSEERA